MKQKRRTMLRRFCLSQNGLLFLSGNSSLQLVSGAYHPFQFLL